MSVLGFLGLDIEQLRVARISLPLKGALWSLSTGTQSMGILSPLNGRVKCVSGPLLLYSYFLIERLGPVSPCRIPEHVTAAEKRPSLLPDTCPMRRQEAENSRNGSGKTMTASTGPPLPLPLPLSLTSPAKLTPRFVRQPTPSPNEACLRYSLVVLMFARRLEFKATSCPFLRLFRMTIRPSGAVVNNIWA